MRTSPCASPYGGSAAHQLLFCDVPWLRIASSLLDESKERASIILVRFKGMSVITKVGQIRAAEILARDGSG